MKQAFLILAHKNPAQLDRLVAYLRENDAIVLIHIDKKSLHEFFAFFEKYETDDKVKIYSQFKVYWGSFNQIRASHLLLEESIKNFKFDYVHLISGQDLPIKKLTELGHFLSNAKGKDFVHIFNFENKNTWDGNGGIERMELFWFLNYPERLKYFFTKVNVIIHVFQNKLKFLRSVDFKMNGGSNWYSLSYHTSTSVVDYVKKNPAFFERFKNTRCADEIFLASILLNAGLEQNVISNYLRFIDWQTGPEYPRTFRMEDLERLKSAQNVFFARKFDEKTDNFIIDKVYSEILN